VRDPRAGWTSVEEVWRRGPSSEADLTRERCEPSCEAEPARGGALLGRSGGLRGPPRRGLCRVCMFYVRFEVGLVFCVFFRF
jgi:hypothetical protein